MNKETMDAIDKCSEYIDKAFERGYILGAKDACKMVIDYFLKDMIKELDVLLDNLENNTNKEENSQKSQVV